MELVDEGHDARLRLGDLDVGPQPFHIPGGQRQVVLPSQVEDGLQAHAAIQMAVQVDKRQAAVQVHIEMIPQVIPTINGKGQVKLVRSFWLYNAGTQAKKITVENAPAKSLKSVKNQPSAWPFLARFFCSLPSSCF